MPTVIQNMNASSAWRSRVTFSLMGFVALLIQVTLIRQLLSVLSGNEIEIGITLSAWLFLYGAGSLVGGSLEASRKRLAASFIIAGVLFPPTVAAIRGIRLLVEVPPGEVLSLSATLLVTLASIAPLALASGLQFPLAVGLLQERRYAGPHVYALETLGFFGAGLVFTFVVSTRIDAVTLASGVSCLLIIMAALTWGRKAVLAFLVLPVAASLLWGPAVRALPYKPFALDRLRESRFGELALVRSGDQSSLFRSGQFLYAVADAESDETAIHLAMSLHPRPRKILVIGEAPARIREFLKYPGVEVTYLLEDPLVYSMLGSGKTAPLTRLAASPSVSILATEGRRFLKGAGRGQSWDLVFLDQSPPVTAAGNRFFTREFFEEVRRVLEPDGLLVLMAMRGHGYVSPSAARVNASIRAALEQVYPEVVSTRLEYGIMVASGKPVDTAVEQLARRFRERQVPTRFFQSYIFADAFGPDDGPESAAGEEADVPANTDSRPAAYLFNLLHWAELQRNRAASTVLHTSAGELAALLGFLFLAGSAAAATSRNRAVYFSTFSTGFVSLSLSMTLALGFQSHFGHVYEAIALLTSAFMAGAFLGARGSLRLVQDNVLRHLAGIEVGFVLFCLLLTVLPDYPFLFYAANVLAGLLTGAQFSLATRSVTGSAERLTAARLYGLDMVGSSAGALLAAAVIVPVSGLGQTFVLLSLVKGTSVLALLRPLLFNRR